MVHYKSGIVGAWTTPSHSQVSQWLNQVWWIMKQTVLQSSSSKHVILLCWLGFSSHCVLASGSSCLLLRRQTGWVSVKEEFLCVVVFSWICVCKPRGGLAKVVWEDVNPAILVSLPLNSHWQFISRARGRGVNNSNCETAVCTMDSYEAQVWASPSNSLDLAGCHWCLFEDVPPSWYRKVCRHEPSQDHPNHLPHEGGSSS